MENVGIVQRNLGENEHSVMGSVPQRVPSYLRTLEVLLQTPGTVLSSIVPATLEPEAVKWTEGLLQEVLVTLGINGNNSFPDDKRLEDLGMDSLQSTDVQQILARKYNIHRTPAEVTALTIGQLKELSSQ